MEGGRGGEEVNDRMATGKVALCLSASRGLVLIRAWFKLFHATRSLLCVCYYTHIFRIR